MFEGSTDPENNGRLAMDGQPVNVQCGIDMSLSITCCHRGNSGKAFSVCHISQSQPWSNNEAPRATATSSGPDCKYRCRTISMVDNGVVLPPIFSSLQWQYLIMKCWKLFAKFDTLVVSVSLAAIENTFDLWTFRLVTFFHRLGVAAHFFLWGRHHLEVRVWSSSYNTRRLKQSIPRKETPRYTKLLYCTPRYLGLISLMCDISFVIKYD